MAKKARAKPKPKLEVSPHIDQIVQAEVDRNDKKPGARLSLAKPCPFCKHVYVKPCSDKTKESCPNFKHLQSRSKK